VSAHVCPECGKSCRGANLLAIHRVTKHNIALAGSPAPAAPPSKPVPAGGSRKASPAVGRAASAAPAPAPATDPEPGEVDDFDEAF